MMGWREEREGVGIGYLKEERGGKEVPDVLSLLLSTIASLPGNWATY